MLAVAGIAAYVSYWHAYGVVRAYGETGITARLEPDGNIHSLGARMAYLAGEKTPLECAPHAA